VGYGLLFHRRRPEYRNPHGEERHLRIRVSRLSGRHTFLVSRTEAQVIVQVLTGKKPSFGDEGKITDDVARPARPPDPNEWLSGDVWDLISRCWSTSLDERPGPDTVMNTLDDAGDTVELGRMELREADLICFVNDCRDGPNDDQDVKKAKAQRFVDALDSVCQFGNQVSQVT
jgi:hypothetical protein